MKLSALAFVILALGIVLGLALRATVFQAEAARPPTPTPPGPQPVEEQNLDANGNIAVHEQGVADVNVVSMPAGSGGVCYTNWNAATCAVGWTAVSTGEWTSVVGHTAGGGGAGVLICASAKTESPFTYFYLYSDTTGHNNETHTVSHEPCAVCCK